MNLLESKPYSGVVMAPVPEPEPPVPLSEEIHTIAEGHMLDHDRSTTCWCGPLQDEAEPRIWHHIGLVNGDHYETKRDAIGNDVTPTLACAGCGRVMPKGRSGICLACLTTLARKAETEQEKAAIMVLDRAAKGG